MQSLGERKAFGFSFGHTFGRKKVNACLLNLLYVEVVNLKFHYDTVSATLEFCVLICCI